MILKKENGYEIEYRQKIDNFNRVMEIDKLIMLGMFIFFAR